MYPIEVPGPGPGPGWCSIPSSKRLRIQHPAVLGEVLLVSSGELKIVVVVVADVVEEDADVGVSL